MFKKISAIAAFVALMVSGVTPGYAAPNQSSQTQSWFYSQYNTDSSTFNDTTTWSFNVPAGVTEVRTSVAFEFGADFIAANVGKVFDVDVVLKKPNGEIFTNGEEGGYFRISGNYPNLPYTILDGDGLMEGSRSMNTSRYGTKAASVPSGTWTAELVATLDGVPVSFSATNGAANASLKAQSQHIRGLGIIPAIPSSLSSAEYTSATCVDPALAADGDRLLFRSDFTNADGTVEHYDYGANAYTLSSGNYTQTSHDVNNRQYLDWSDELEAEGLSVSRTAYSYVASGTPPFMEVSIYNETTGTEVSSNCAGPVPAVPQMNIDSTWGGTIRFLDEPGVYRWEYQVVEASDTTVTAAQGTSYKQWGTLTNGRYSFGLNGTFESGTLYKVRVRSTNGVASSAWSEFSASSGLIGPDAPAAPTLAISSATSAKVTISKVTGIDNTSYYKAKLYNVNDRATLVGQSSDWNCQASMTDQTKVECSISADSLVAPNQYVAVALVKNSSGIYSVNSADSNIVTGITAGYTLNAPLSGLSTQGKARLVGDDVLGELLNSSAQKVTTTPDGLGGVYLTNRTAPSELKVSKLGGSPIVRDNSFGSAGFVTVSIDSEIVNPYSTARTTWFGDSANRKWVATIGSETGLLFAEGTASTATATSTAIDVGAYCRNHFNDSDAAGEIRVYSAPTTRPVAVVVCHLWAQQGQSTNAILVKINVDGSLTELAQMTPEGANDFYVIYSGGDSYEMPELANSVNITASGSEVAIAIAIVNSTYTPGNYNVSPPVPSTTTAHSRVLWRIPANLGSPTSTALTYTTNQSLMSMGGPSSEPTLRLQPFNNGTKIYAMVLKSPSGCTYSGTPPNVVQTCTSPGSYKLHEANVASGNLNTDAAAKPLVGITSAATEFQAIVPGAGNLLHTLTKSVYTSCSNVCVTTGGQITPGVIDVSTGATARGEMVAYSIGGAPVNALWTNASGKLQWLMTKPNATGHSLVEWQSVEIASAPVNAPTITSGAIGLSLNAGGSKIEITGTNLNLVTKVLFGTKEAKFTKTATKLTVTVPSGTAAGSVAVTVTYTGGVSAVPAGNWNYMGATKRVQTLTPTGLGDPTHTGSTETERNFTVASSLQGYSVVVTSKTSTICTYVSGVIDFIGNGTCVLEAKQAGDAVTNATSAIYEIYYESAVNASALYSTDAGKPTITITGQGLASVSKVMFGNIEVVPTKKTATSITVKVPAAPTSGANVDVSLKYTNGTVVDTDLTFDYVGATKLSQTVTLAAGFSLATYGDAARTLTASSGDELTGLPYVYSTTTKTVCAVTGDQLRFLTAGDCKVKATQAGNAGVNAASSADFTISVALKSQTIEVDESAREITLVEGTNLGATNSNSEVLLEYTSSNELVCSVDGEGTIIGLSAGTCTVTIDAPADPRYIAAEQKSIAITVSDPDPSADSPADAADVIEEEPVPLANGGVGTFVSFGADSDLQVSWDRATGKLTPRATGVYTGHIVATISFVKAGVTYTCTNVFGSTSKLTNPKKPTAPTALGQGATAKQIAAFNKAQATYVKALAAYKVAYNKVWGTKVFSSKNFCSDTSKVTGTAFSTLKKVSKTSTEKKAEANALKALKGFTGDVTITVKRWRAWPTTMKNKKGNAGTGKTISSTRNINTLTLG